MAKIPAKTKTKAKPKTATAKVKRKRIKPFVKWIFLSLLLIIAIIAGLLSPIFNVRNIVVLHNNKVSTEEIINYSGITVGGNIFEFFKPSVIDKIKGNPYIDEVTIKRKLPNDVLIEVTERIPTYMLKCILTTGELYAYINNQGYILELSSEPLELPTISCYKTVMDDIAIKAGNRLNLEDLTTLEKIIEITSIAKDNNILDQIIGFIMEDNRLVLKLKNKKVAYIRDMTNINIKMINLKAIMEREKDKSGEIFLDGMNEKDTVIFREGEVQQYE